MLSSRNTRSVMRSRVMPNLAKGSRIGTSDKRGQFGVPNRLTKSKQKNDQLVSLLLTMARWLQWNGVMKPARGIKSQPDNLDNTTKFNVKRKCSDADSNVQPRCEHRRLDEFGQRLADKNSLIVIVIIEVIYEVFLNRHNTRTMGIFSPRDWSTPNRIATMKSTVVLYTKQKHFQDRITRSNSKERIMTNLLDTRNKYSQDVANRAILIMFWKKIVVLNLRISKCKERKGHRNEQKRFKTQTHSILLCSAV